MHSPGFNTLPYGVLVFIINHDSWEHCRGHFSEMCFAKLSVHHNCLSDLFASYSLCFKIKVMFAHKLFGEISLKLCQTNWNVAKSNVNVVVGELPSQIMVYTCLTIDIWTWWRRRTSTRFYVLRCHPPKMAGFQWNWWQKFLTLLWTPPACRKVLSESYTMHVVSC